MVALHLVEYHLAGARQAQRMLLSLEVVGLERTSSPVLVPANVFFCVAQDCAGTDQGR